MAPSAETPRTSVSTQGGIPEARKKDVRLRERFQLPDTESCIEHFSCAYSNKILRQGHIYVMLRHVCFHSSVYPTVLTIPTTEIEEVLPKNNLFFPNSIEIVQTNGTKHFFTSFLSRERCLDLIKSRWQTEIARAADTEAIPSLASVPGKPSSSNSSLPNAPEDISPKSAATKRKLQPNVSLRRKGWPLSSEPSRDPNTFTEEGWTNILDLTLQGWDVTDVLTIFENNDSFFTDWHNSLGDTDVSSTDWELEDGDRKRQVKFTARIHDPPMGSGKFAKCVQTQKARMHCDGSFTLDSSQHMPNLTIASFRVEAYWRLVQLPGRTQVTVHLRVRFLKYSMLRATITSQSTSQAISCFAALKQRLGLRFPTQGTAADAAAVANEANHAAADIDFALRIGKDAARRMPQTWQDHLLASLSQGQPATPNPFSDLVQWFPTACQAALVALLFVLLVVPRLGPTEAPHQHRGAFISPLGTPAAYEMLLQGCSNGTCMLNASTIAAFSAMDTMTLTEASNTEPTSRSGSAAAEPERSQDDTEQQGLLTKLLGASSSSVRSSSQKSGSGKSDPTATASKEEPKGAVAATNLDDIDIEGGIEALLFLLEAAKKSKERKQAANGEEYEAIEAADS